MTGTEAQTKKIMQFMLDGYAVTQELARELFGCARLAARIHDIRHGGVTVLDDWEYELNKDGKVVKKWKRYFIPVRP